MDRLRRDPHPDACGRCHGAGWIMTEKEGVEVAVPCPKCSAENKRRRLLSHAEIPPHYSGKGFDEYAAQHESQRQALFIAKKFVQEFPLVQRGLLFAGPCGVGKTHLSVAILRTLISEKLITGRFVDEAELLRRLQYSYGPDSPETQREVMTPLMEVDLLVWDDLGTGRATAWVQETIRTILNHRYTYNKPTILSTNWPLQSSADSKADMTLENRIGVRLYSRVMEMCRLVEVKGVDFRISIHKAGRDSREKRPAPLKASQPPSPGKSSSDAGKKASAPGKLDLSPMLQCPHCRSRRAQELDRKSQGSGRSLKVDLHCRCLECEQRFGAKYTHATARMEFFT
ncbi:MAG TPA: ATP-binding protein [Acidobacteriota bacterium]|nr:ATP-binding protein [Acidobacteriota bacterium]